MLSNAWGVHSQVRICLYTSLSKFAGQAGKLMRLSVMRSWVEERKLRIFDNAVVGIVLTTLVISFAAVLFAALAIPGTRVFVSLIFFCVQFRRNA